MKTLKPISILDNDSTNEILFDLLYDLFINNEGYVSSGFSKHSNNVYVYFHVNDKHLVLCTQTETKNSIRPLRSKDDTIRVYFDQESALDYVERMMKLV